MLTPLRPLAISPTFGQRPLRLHHQPNPQPPYVAQIIINFDRKVDLLPKGRPVKYGGVLVSPPCRFHPWWCVCSGRPFATVKPPYPYFDRRLGRCRASTSVAEPRNKVAHLVARYSGAAPLARINAAGARMAAPVFRRGRSLDGRHLGRAGSLAIPPVGQKAHARSANLPG